MFLDIIQETNLIVLVPTERKEGESVTYNIALIYLLLTAPRFTTLKVETIHVSMTEGCTDAVTASPQHAALLLGSR